MNKSNKYLLSFTLICFSSISLLNSCKGNENKEIGFECVDNNIDNYNTNSIFNKDNGIKVYAKYSNGNKVEVSKTNYTYSVSSNSNEVNSSLPFNYSGTYTCTIKYKNYKDYSYSFNVIKVDKIITSIKVEHSADINTFEVGEKYSSKGLTIKVIYSDNTTEIVSNTFTTNYDLHEFTNLDVGNKKVIVTYKNHTTSYYITVKAQSKIVSSVDKYTDPDKLTYDIGETFSYKGLSLKITYQDTTFEIINSGFTTNYDNHVFNEDDVGKKQVLVNYKDYQIVYYITINKTIIPATDISISPTTYECLKNTTKQLTITYTPYNANADKEVTWESLDTSIATVDNNGLVTIKDDATVGSTVDIVATLTVNQKTSKSTFKVVNYPSNSNTILVYMSGNTLESKNGLASDDLTEMINATNQNELVNIVIQTGGCNSWKKFDISNSKIGRYHIKDNQLVLDQQLDQANMGESSTLENFIEYGLTNYPANRNSLILWNHGKAIRGVCQDQNYNDDSLTTSEVSNAITNAFNKTGFNKKFEFIGYDACVMQVQDIASINADHANYMICSQENEGAGGWFYTTWLNRLYTYPDIDTLDIATSICDTYCSHTYCDDYTMSILDLSYMNDYVTAFEELSKSISTIIDISPTNNWNELVTLANKSIKYGYSTKETHNYPHDVFDLNAFLDLLVNSQTFASLDVSKVKNGMKNLIKVNKYGPYYQGTKPCGLSFFLPVSGCAHKYQYTEKDSKLSSWRNMCIKYGNWASDN